jgi:hypothetical protein
MSLLGILVAVYAIGMYVYDPGAARVPDDMQHSYAPHSFGIYTHIFASAFTLLLGPFQFSSRFRTRWPALHRWAGRAYLGVGVLFGGLAGLYMSCFASGGMVARSGFAFLAVGWLATGFLAYRAVRKNDFLMHRRWMVRNYSLTLAAVTLRLYLPLAFVLQVPFEVSYPIIAWLCWVPNLLAGELAARTTQPESAFRGEQRIHKESLD